MLLECSSNAFFNFQTLAFFRVYERIQGLRNSWLISFLEHGYLQPWKRKGGVQSETEERQKGKKQVLFARVTRGISNAEIVISWLRFRVKILLAARPLSWWNLLEPKEERKYAGQFGRKEIVLFSFSTFRRVHLPSSPSSPSPFSFFTSFEST